MNLGKATWYPTLAVGLSMVSLVLVKSGRDAVFFEQDGLARLPLAYLIIAVAAVLAAMAHLRLMRFMGARPARVAVVMATAMALMTFTPLLAGGHPTTLLLFFVFVPIAFAAVFAAVWLLAGDLLEDVDGDLMGGVYARIGAGSMIGGILGGALGRVLSTTLAPRMLVLTGGLVLLAVSCLIVSAHRSHPATDAHPVPRTARPQGHGPRSSVIGEPYVRALLGISAVASLAALLIDFQFYAVVTQGGHNSAEFFSGFYLLLNLVSFLMQVLVTPILQRRIGIGGTLLILPMALMGGVGWIAYSSTLFSRTLLRMTEGGLKASVNRSVWEQAYLPIDSARREKAKVLVDGAAARMSEGVGAGILYWLSAGGKTLSLAPLSWVIGVAGATWLGLILYLVRSGCNQVTDKEQRLRLPDG